MLMRMLYPLRPLTRSGRVTIGVALGATFAVFAAILLVAWAPSNRELPPITSTGAAP